MKKWRPLAVVMALGVFSLPASAGTIDVLWYQGGTAQGTVAGYDANIMALAALAPSAPGGNTWNVTFWNSGPMPAGTFNVLVVASPEGFWSTFPDYSALNAAGLSFDPTTQRILVTGQDADWHYQNFPGPSAFNGPQGFLLDSINWAGSGTGLGLVDLGQTGANICAGGASLSLSGFTGLCSGTDDVRIPASQASFPINTNLTSAGLSNWSTSAHVEFSDLSSAWDGINTAGACTDPTGATCDFVTIVSATTASGGITPSSSTTPEPSTLLLLGSGLALLFRRRTQSYEKNQTGL